MIDGALQESDVPPNYLEVFINKVNSVIINNNGAIALTVTFSKLNKLTVSECVLNENSLRTLSNNELPLQELWCRDGFESLRTVNVESYKYVLSKMCTFCTEFHYNNSVYYNKEIISNMTALHEVTLTSQSDHQLVSSFAEHTGIVQIEIFDNSSLDKANYSYMAQTFKNLHTLKVIGVDIFTEELLKEFVVGCLNLKSVLMTHTQVTGLGALTIVCKSGNNLQSLAYFDNSILLSSTYLSQKEITELAPTFKGDMCIYHRTSENTVSLCLIE